MLAAVADRPKAQALVARIGNLSGAGATAACACSWQGRTALAFVGDFLAIGTEDAVHAAVDRDQGAGVRLADLPAYRRASEGRPDERSLDAYASAAGVREVLAPRDGLLGALGALLDRPGLTAAGASVTRRGAAACARTCGSRAARRATPRSSPCCSSACPRAPRRTSGVRGALRLTRLLGRLGVEGSLERLGDALAEEAGIELDRDLLAPLSGELAIAVTGASGDPAATAGGAPVVTLTARTADHAADRGGARAAAGAGRAAARRARARCPRGQPESIGGAGRLHAAA